MRLFFYILLTAFFFVMCSPKYSKERVVDEYKAGRCVIFIENDSIKVQVILRDSSIIISADDNQDPCKLIFDPQEKKSNYSFCGYNIDLSDPGFLEIAKLKRTILKDTTIVISSNVKDNDISDIVRIDTIGKCKTLLENRSVVKYSR
jgi:hypothetical protein